MISHHTPPAAGERDISRALPDLLRPRDIAERLNLSVARVYQLLSSNVIPSVRVAGAIRVPRASWERWLADVAEQASNGARR